MVMTPSYMLPLATPAPDFALLDTVSGRILRLADVRGRTATVVMFICNHCPYVVHVNGGIVALARDYQARGIGFVAICANDSTNPKYAADSPAAMTATAKALGYSFPYLHDATQDVARAYHAACTPDFFVFDAALCLAYRGQLDDSRPGNGKPVTGLDLRAALDALIDGRPLLAKQMPSIGCNIKWKA